MYILRPYHKPEVRAHTWHYQPKTFKMCITISNSTHRNELLGSKAQKELSAISKMADLSAQNDTKITGHCVLEIWSSLELTGATVQMCARKATHCASGQWKVNYQAQQFAVRSRPWRINTKENRSLCVHTLLCFGNVELHFENCPCFISNWTWCMPNPCELSSILKCQLPLVSAGLFQGLDMVIPLMIGEIDQWKVDFEKKLLKIKNLGKSIGIQWHFKSLLHENDFQFSISSSIIESIEDYKIIYVKSQNWSLDHILRFRLCNPLTQNWVSRQLLPFDMLNQIMLSLVMD